MLHHNSRKTLCHWIGLREKLQETMVFTIKYNIGLSCKFSHHPILWLWFPYGSSHGTPGAAAFAGGGFAAGAVSAATGALAAKAVSDRSERRAIEERLAEVKRDLEGLGFGKMGRYVKIYDYNMEE